MIGVYFIWAAIGALFVWAYGDTVVGFLIYLAVRFIGNGEHLRFPWMTFRLYTQDGSLFHEYGFQWEAKGRRFFFFRSYMGWHNHSEGHHRDDCKDAAYCQWHGSL